MIRKEKCIVLDIDGTICPDKRPEERYMDIIPYPEMVDKISEYKKSGFYIIVYTARNMLTYAGNIGKINANTAKITIDWLDRHNVPYDEIHFGKPWQGKGGFYLDNNAIRPNEFINLKYHEIMELLKSG